MINYLSKWAEGQAERTESHKKVYEVLGNFSSCLSKAVKGAVGASMQMN